MGQNLKKWAFSGVLLTVEGDIGLESKKKPGNWIGPPFRSLA
jgi:hypothetical protein